jgi:hypothetical protein
MDQSQALQLLQLPAGASADEVAARGAEVRLQLLKQQEGLAPQSADWQEVDRHLRELALALASLRPARSAVERAGAAMLASYARHDRETGEPAPEPESSGPDLAAPEQLTGPEPAVPDAAATFDQAPPLDEAPGRPQIPKSSSADLSTAGASWRAMWLCLLIAGVLALIVYYYLGASSPLQPTVETTPPVSRPAAGAATAMVPAPQSAELTAPIAPESEPLPVAQSQPDPQPDPGLGPEAAETSESTEQPLANGQGFAEETGLTPAEDALTAAQEAQIEAWLQRGMEAVRSFHLTRPEAGSALSFATRIAALEPDRPEEVRLKTAIQAAYLALLEGALLRGDSELVDRYRELALAMGVSPEEISAVLQTAPAPNPD